MELRQLECFQTVSRLRNFTRAAEELHVTQPSITNAIRRLEETLGVQLFDRSQKKVTLTPEGQAFHARAEKILYEVRQAIHEMEDLKACHKGSMKLAAPPMIGAYLFPHIFTHFKAAYPHLDLLVFEEGSLAAKNLIEREELDLGIIILPSSPTMLHMMPIMEEEIKLCLSLNHPLSTAESVSFGDLTDEPFILLKEDFFHRSLILKECSHYGFTPRIVFSSNQIETIKAMVAKNAGISFLMNMVIDDHPRIVGISLQQPLMITIGLVWKKGRYLSKAAQAFIDFMTSYTDMAPPAKDSGNLRKSGHIVKHI